MTKFEPVIDVDDYLFQVCAIRAAMHEADEETEKGMCIRISLSLRSMCHNLYMAAKSLNRDLYDLLVENHHDELAQFMRDNMQPETITARALQAIDESIGLMTMHLIAVGRKERKPHEHATA